MPLPSSVLAITIAGAVSAGALATGIVADRALAGRSDADASGVSSPARAVRGAGLPSPTWRAPAAPGVSVATAASARGVPGPGPWAAPRFGWPLRPSPRVVRRFAVGPQPWSPGHRGVDLAGSAGQAVLAAGAGVVTFAGRVAGRGVVVVAHAAGLRTTYEPVTAVVDVGRAVATGERIGVLMLPGSHCPGPCLHWGALRGQIYVDPLTLLGPPSLPVLLPDALGVS